MAETLILDGNAVIQLPDGTRIEIARALKLKLIIREQLSGQAASHPADDYDYWITVTKGNVVVKSGPLASQIMWGKEAGAKFLSWLPSDELNNLRQSDGVIVSLDGNSSLIGVTKLYRAT